MSNLRSRTLSALGSLAGTALIAGFFFAECIYPFVRHAPSQTFTCADKEIASACSDSDTILGFLASVCGKDRLALSAASVSVLLIGDQPSQEPAGTDMTAKCGGTQMKWSLDQGQKITSSADLRKAATNDEARLAVTLFTEWSAGSVDLGGARAQLLK